MRVWSLAPQLLDRQGLVACWRETLLAQAVLTGNTAGYKNHPQLLRFKRTSAPADYIGSYLHGIADDADRRSYRFDRSRVQLGLEESAALRANSSKIAVTSGQIQFECHHLLSKLEVRNPELAPAVESLIEARVWEDPQEALDIVHPLFVVVPGGIEEWEKA